MTRCVSCNKNLSDFEATRKHKETGEYLDMCGRCYRDLVGIIPVVERDDLRKEESVIPVIFEPLD